MWNRKLLNLNVFLTAIFLLSLTAIMTPTSSWVYQDDTPSDLKFEKFGPRADKLLINLYANVGAEWTALETGIIDLTDWPLNKSEYEKLTMLPYNETINVVSCGPELNFVMLDINNNQTVGGSPNPGTVVSFRQAIAHLINRSYLNTIIGPGFYLPIWVPMSPALAKYYLDISNPYPYDPTAASNLLDADGFPLNPATGWRFWDRNGNGQEEPEEFLELRFVIRVDGLDWKAFGNLIVNELVNVGVRVSPIYVNAAQARIIVKVNRDFHLYINYYSVFQADPTYLYYYFHSSMIPNPNHNSINDAELDYWLETLMYAITQEDAILASKNAQQVFVNKSFKVPIWVYAVSKAMYRRYTGGTAGSPVLPDDGENIYRNATWQGVVSIPGYCIDNFWSFLNMHPTGFAYGHNGNMTIRHGFNEIQYVTLNPIYSFGSQDLRVLDLTYDRLIRRSPDGNITEPKWMSWIAKNYTVGTYQHPLFGTNTKIKVTMRTDVGWADGTPLTTADVYFTFKELLGLLKEHGHPLPSWVTNVQNILDFKIFDAYNFEILFGVTSYWALSWIGNTPILPKHVWKPIVETGDPTGFAPDPNLIGSGPWRLKDYVDSSHILMVANSPGSTVQTNLPNSTSITSPKGYFQFYPVYEDIHFKLPYEYNHKIPINTTVEYKVILENLIREEIILENITNVYLTHPDGSIWNETWPIKGQLHQVWGWIDNGNGILDISDILAFSFGWPPIEWYHVENMSWKPDFPRIDSTGVWVLELKPVITADKYLYFDNLMIEPPTNVYLKPEIPHEQQRNITILCNLHLIELGAHIKEPNWNSWKLNSTWLNYTFPFWGTIREDIVGSTLYDDSGVPSYPYKDELKTPDFEVNIRDIAEVARAFGSYPGHPRWSPYADIISDYEITIRDIAAVARYFGWTCP